MQPTLIHLYIFFEFTATGRLHIYYIYVFDDFQLQGALYYIHIVFSGTETSGALEQKRIAFLGFPVHGRPETKTQTKTKKQQEEDLGAIS